MRAADATGCIDGGYTAAAVVDAVRRADGRAFATDGSMKKYLLPLFMTALLLGPADRSEANLIVNGGFEDPVQSGWNLYDDIAGWTAGGGDPIEIGLGGIYGVSDFEGANVLELDSTGNATVSQDVTIAEAGIYQLSFLAALRSGVDASSQGFSVALGNLLSFTAPPPGSSVMSPYVFTFNVAAPGTYSLSFTGTGTSDTFGTLVDDVQLQLNGVPDGGATAMLLGLALAGVGVFRRMAVR